MNKIAGLFLSAFLLSSGAVFAQGEMDAFRYSQPGLMSGTARYQAMGGAFGALGGDISVMSANPAGLGVYRSSEVVTTLSLSSIKSSSNWNGSGVDAKKTRFNFDNIAYVGYFPTGRDKGLISWNVGFSYNRVKDFTRSYRLSGKQANSLSKYIAEKATNAYVDFNDNGDPVWQGIPQSDFIPLLSSGSNTINSAYDNLNRYWLQGLGYQSGFFGGYSTDPTETSYHSGFGKEVDGKWVDYSPNNMALNVNEKGGIDRYNFSFASNISDRVYLGATLAVVDLNYSMSSAYTETFGSRDNMTLDNYMSADGTGYTFNIGAIARLTNFLRLGVAYNSPTWYKMTNYFQGIGSSYIEGLNPPGMEGKTPDQAYSEFQLRTPDKWIFSVAAILGKYGLLSVDYELSNYKNMRLFDRDGTPYYDDNDFIKEDFGVSNTLRVGGEAKVTPQFAVRVGGAWQTSPMKMHLKNGEIEVLSVGTRPNFTVDKGTAAYSVGLGYRFTPNFYADLTCVYQEYKEDAYVFSRIFNENKTYLDSDAIALKTKTTKVALTLGYKF